MCWVAARSVLVGVRRAGWEDEEARDLEALPEGQAIQARAHRVSPIENLLTGML